MSGVEGTITVLIIDDEPDLCELVRARLERAGGYAVVGEAHDAGTALEAAGAEQPDVVLLDLMLGEEAGSKLVGPLLRAVPGTMIAVYSVLSASEHRSRLLSLGAFTYYEKSDTKHLADEIREDYALFRTALEGEDVLAPSVRRRRDP